MWALNLFANHMIFTLSLIIWPSSDFLCVSSSSGWQVGGKITSRDLLLRKQWSLWSAAGTRGEGGSLVLLGVLGTLVRGTWSLVTSPRIPRPLSSSPLLPFSETPSLSQSYSPNHPVPCFWWLFSRMTRMMRQIWSNIRPWHIYITLSLKFGLRWWGWRMTWPWPWGWLDTDTDMRMTMSWGWQCRWGRWGWQWGWQWWR